MTYLLGLSPRLLRRMHRLRCEETRLLERRSVGSRDTAGRSRRVVPYPEAVLPSPGAIDLASCGFGLLGGSSY